MPSNTYRARIPPDNNRYAEQAIDEFKKVLEQNPVREAAGQQSQGYRLALLQHEEA